MAMQQCPNGHLYDPEKNSSCPFCGNGNSVNATAPLSYNNNLNAGAQFPSTEPLDNYGAPYVVDPHYVAPQPKAVQEKIPPTMPVEPKFEETKYRDDVVNEKGIVEVRGWLVCLEGEKRGMDFKIHSEKNSIGRGAENDISIDFDSSVSMGVNAIVTYDNRNNKFYVYEGEAKNNIYVNDQLLMIPVELNDYDIIEIGETKLLFRSLCNSKFKWETAKQTQ